MKIITILLFISLVSIAGCVSTSNIGNTIKRTEVDYQTTFSPKHLVFEESNKVTVTATPLNKTQVDSIIQNVVTADGSFIYNECQFNTVYLLSNLPKGDLKEYNKRIKLNNHIDELINSGKIPFQVGQSFKANLSDRSFGFDGIDHCKKQNTFEAFNPFITAFNNLAVYQVQFKNESDSNKTYYLNDFGIFTNGNEYKAWSCDNLIDINEDPSKLPIIKALNMPDSLIVPPGITINKLIAFNAFQIDEITFYLKFGQSLKKIQQKIRLDSSTKSKLYYQHIFRIEEHATMRDIVFVIEHADGRYTALNGNVFYADESFLGTKYTVWCFYYGRDDYGFGKTDLMTFKKQYSNPIRVNLTTRFRY